LSASLQPEPRTAVKNLPIQFFAYGYSSGAVFLTSLWLMTSSLD